MICPYRKRVKIIPDGLSKVTVVEFMECYEDECPYWKPLVYVHSEDEFVYRCRKVENECQ